MLIPELKLNLLTVQLGFHVNVVIDLNLQNNIIYQFIEYLEYNNIILCVVLMLIIN